MEIGKLPLPIYQHYDNLLRAYYHQPLTLNDTNITDVLRDIVGLADVAEYLGSMQVVSLCIDNALVKQGQVLYRSVATNPAAWADLAFRVQSEIIFKEAIVHLVGQWNELGKDETILASMRRDIRELCMRKHTELDETKCAIELRIMGYYPSHLQRPTGNTGPGSLTLRGSASPVKTTTYQSDVLCWMALNLFRHWLGQHVCGGLNRYAPDGGYVFYHALGGGGDKYVDHQAIEAFTRFFPLSRKSRNLFESHLGTLKEGVKKYVHDLLQHKSKLASRSHTPGKEAMIGMLDVTDTY